mmetsp:Transcript_17440/g.48339  ORF Transcript_17440/g.48339 Transcript_17440/m.48339 type:complete len:96 (+) Transcript_17440:1718-2005(+)
MEYNIVGVVLCVPRIQRHRVFHIGKLRQTSRPTYSRSEQMRFYSPIFIVICSPPLHVSCPQQGPTRIADPHPNKTLVAVLVLVVVALQIRGLADL